jgi:[ribosomal protein S5]-alanine N-acetyltransferase
MPGLLASSAVPIGSLAAQPQPTLTAGTGVLLRPWSLGDAQAVMDAYQDEAIQRWHVQRADSLAEAREWIAGWRDGWATETGAYWAVADAESGVLLGRAALKHLKFSDGTADVAYWTVPAARGRHCGPGSPRA